MRINELPQTQLKKSKVSQSLLVILVLGVEVFMIISFGKDTIITPPSKAKACIKKSSSVLSLLAFQFLSWLPYFFGTTKTLRL